MLFNSIDFLLFFPVVCVVYFAVPQKYKYIWLLLASYCFYMCWSVSYAFLMFTSTLVTYISGLVIGNEKFKNHKKKAVLLSFIINLGILFFFKYFYFTLGNINAVLSVFNIKALSSRINIVLPVGISFYTFQALSYTVDVYRGDVRCEKNFLKYALFVSFFPQLVAGPIERSKNLLSQINEKHRFNGERVRSGLLMMLWGYFLKLNIADRAIIFVDKAYGNVAGASGAALLTATVLFSLVVYCDFYSYSIIAKGAAHVMGFRLMDNFNAPYLSESIAEFWKNWHISLTSWFRDYLYIPLGGNRKGKKRKYINTMIVFLLSGLWHGAQWTYVAWGGIHGAYKVVGEATEKIRGRLTASISKNNVCVRVLKMAVNFVLVSFAWIFFRSSNMADAVKTVSKIFSLSSGSGKWNAIGKYGLNGANFAALAAAVAILLVVDIAKKCNINPIAKIQNQCTAVKWTIYLSLIFSVLIFGIYGSGYNEGQFIYFQF